MAQTLDKNGNVIQNGFSTNLNPAQLASSTSFQTPSATSPLPSSISAMPSVANNMTSSQITAPTPKIQGSLTGGVVPPPDITPVSTANAGYESILNQQQKNLEASQANTRQNSSIDYVYNALGMNGSASLEERKAQEQADLNNQYGVAQTTGRLGELAKETQNNDLMAKAQIQRIGANTGGITNTDQAGFEEKIYRETASKNLLLAAESLTLQGKLDSANIAIKNAIDTKYAGQEARLANHLKFLEINKDALGREGEKQKSLAEAKMKDLQAVKEDGAVVTKMIIGASPYAPPSVISQAKSLQARGKSPVEVAIALGKYGGDFMGDLVKRSTIAKNNADVAQSMASYEKTMKEIKAIGQAPQINAPVGTNANFVQNLAASAVNKESLGQSERIAVTKNLTVLDQLDSLQANIAKQNKTGFITGKVNNVMASIGQNADVGTINAQLQAIVPNLARGVYGEVGVLTDNDIENYRKTLPTLTMPKDQNDAVLALTLKVVQKNLKNTLETAANSKMDVSRFAPQYQQVTNRINEINDRIGVSKQEVLQYGRNNPKTQQMITELSAGGMPYSQILQVLGAEN